MITMKLKEIGKITTGKTPSKNIKNAFGNYISFLTPKDFNGQRYSNITERSLSIEGVENVYNYIVKGPSVSVTCIGSDMGKTIFNEKDIISNQQINSISEIDSNINPMYLYYLLYTKRKQLHFIGSAQGSTMPILNKSDFGNLEFSFPSRKEQDIIVAKINSFDSKIEINNKINTNLLEFVTLIWKKYNSNTVNGVTLKKLANTIVTGKTPSTKIKENYGNDIPFVKIPDMHNKVFIDETSQSLTLQGANSQKNKYIPANSILVSCIGTPGLVSITDKNIQTNQQINSLILDEKYLYCTFIELRSNKDMIGNLGSGGTTIKNLNKTDFSNIVINIPNTDKLLEKFNSVARPIFNNIHENMIQTQKLKKIKATLLSEYF